MSGILDNEEIRERNIKALNEDSLQVKKASILPKYLQMQLGYEELKAKPFKMPFKGYPSVSNELNRKLRLQKLYIPFGSKTPIKSILPSTEKTLSPSLSDNKKSNDEITPERKILDNKGDLVLWKPEKENVEDHPIIVDELLAHNLRDHQIEGIKFMFECVNGLRDYSGNGCILADEMGLGKTLQSITVAWTMLRQGTKKLGGIPLAKRVLIVCPSSLVKNWMNEFNKWLKGKEKVLALCDLGKNESDIEINKFLNGYYEVLIISYEKLVKNIESFQNSDACQLLICDEAHKLKNHNTKNYRCILEIACKKRIMLTGTPLQNDLIEFYAMINICNPGFFTKKKDFKQYYENPILHGREPNATDMEIELGNERSKELSNAVQYFILRRKNDLLIEHLPEKVMQIICCKATELQKVLYKRLIKYVRKKLNGENRSTVVLSSLLYLQKVCNHPILIYEKLYNKLDKKIKFCEKYLPKQMFEISNGNNLPKDWEHYSGKLSLLANMMHVLRTTTTDRIIVVSCYTETLKVIMELCKERLYPYYYLDGSVGSVIKRQEMVDKFNDLNSDSFVFLLSTRAGGCGINLIGANRLVLFDSDWNPATDKQAAGRAWRDGQKKKVYIYRFLTCCSIEEKIYQRQLSKEGLQGVINEEGSAKSNLMSKEELHNLFKLKLEDKSDTYEYICDNDIDNYNNDIDNYNNIYKEQVGLPLEDELKNWAHHTSLDTVSDNVLKSVGKDKVSFVFSCEINKNKLNERIKINAQSTESDSNSNDDESEILTQKTMSIAASSTITHFDHNEDEQNSFNLNDKKCLTSNKRKLDLTPLKSQKNTKLLDDNEIIFNDSSESSSESENSNDTTTIDLIESSEDE